MLIVDDDAAIRELLATLLGFEGWDIDVAPDGNAALETATAVRPDVVLVDVTMPGLSGYEVCRRLKAVDPAPRVIMVTGRSTQGDELIGVAAGADGYLTKPFSPLELLEIVQGNGR